MTDVIQATVKAHNKTPGKLEWRVLIVDQQSMRMVSACTKMHELSAEGITSTFSPVKEKALCSRISTMNVIETPYMIQHPNSIIRTMFVRIIESTSVSVVE